MSPVISVIIPTYNRAQYLPDAVDSVLRQTFQDFEVIVVDDGSTDETAEVMKQYASDQRVHYFQKENGGCASARNFGLDKAQGEYVEHLDSDDTLLDNDLELKIEALRTLPDDVAGVFSDYYRCLHPDIAEKNTYFKNFDFIKSVEPITESVDPEKQLYVFSRKFYDRHLFFCLITPTILLRQSVYSQIGVYDEKLSSGQDWEFFTRLTRDYKVACLDVPTGHVNFWIEGNVSDTVRLNSNKLRMFERFLQIESCPVLRKNLRKAIGNTHFHLAYLCYKRKIHHAAIKHALCAIIRGTKCEKSMAILLLCLSPGFVVRFLRRVNPYKGSPIR